MRLIGAFVHSYSSRMAATAARTLLVLAEVLGADRAKDVVVITGDLGDSQALSLAIKQSRPDALIDASSAIPFGHKKGQPANSADRAKMLPVIVAALAEDQRIAACNVIIVGGQLLPEPGGAINNWGAWLLAGLLKHVVARALWHDTENAIHWLFTDSPPALRFSMARMGQMVEEPPRGVLQPEPTLNNIQRGTASFVDVGAALVELAGDTSGTWSRKALFFNYPAA